METREYSIETLAYAAGLFDGEGCISIAKTFPTEKNHRVNHGYELYVSISSTDKAVISWLKTTFNGNITDRSCQPSMVKLGWRAACEWRLASNEAVHFLDLMLPYLRIKRHQAMIGIAFQSYKKSHSLYFKDYQRGQVILAQEEEYYQHLSSLHSTKRRWTQSETFREEIRAYAMEPIIASPLIPATLAYMAGVLDGEGCIRIGVSKPDRKVGKGHLRQMSYRLCIKIAITDRAIIDWLQASYPAHVSSCSSEQGRAKTGCSPAWEWRLESDAAYRFLVLVAPFMHTKQRHAILAQEFQLYRNEYSRYVQGTRPQEVLDRQEEYRQQINGMNAKPAPKSA